MQPVDVLLCHTPQHSVPCVKLVPYSFPTSLRPNAQAYARNSKNSLKRLQEVWQDIELPQAQQVAVLEDVISRAHLVWEEAVATAEATQQRLRGEVEAALREIAGIKEELGDDVMRRGAEAELHHLKVRGMGGKAREGLGRLGERTGSDVVLLHCCQLG